MNEACAIRPYSENPCHSERSEASALRRGQREGRFLVAPLLGMTRRMLLGMISLMLLRTTGSEAPQNDKSDIQQLKAGQTAHIGVRLVGEKGRVFGGKFFFLLRQFVNRMKRIGGTNGNGGSAIED